MSRCHRLHTSGPVWMGHLSGQAQQAKQNYQHPAHTGGLNFLSLLWPQTVPKLSPAFFSKHNPATAVGTRAQARMLQGNAVYGQCLNHLPHQPQQQLSWNSPSISKKEKGHVGRPWRFQVQGHVTPCQDVCECISFFSLEFKCKGLNESSPRFTELHQHWSLQNPSLLFTLSFLPFLPPSLFPIPPLIPMPRRPLTTSIVLIFDTQTFLSGSLSLGTVLWTINLNSY